MTLQELNTLFDAACNAQAQANSEDVSLWSCRGAGLKAVVEALRDKVARSEYPLRTINEILASDGVDEKAAGGSTREDEWQSDAVVSLYTAKDGFPAPAAADRIEALEGENAALKADNSVWDKERYETLQMWMRKTEALEGEIGRLNQSLATITDKRWDANARAERLRVALEVMADITSGDARHVALEAIRAAAGGGE
jgi:hypothetical protein